MEEKKIYKLIPKIMGEVGAIEKDRTNPQQGYKFRGIDDVYLALQGPLSKNGVFYATHVLSEKREERQTKTGGTLIYTILTVRFTFFADDASFVEVVTVGEAMDSGDKSSNKAMSSALKYAILQLFCIPTEEEKDTEAHSPEPAPKITPKPQASAADQKPVKPKNPEAKITEKQAARMFAIMKGTDWTSDDLKAHLAEYYNIGSSKDLTMRQYDDVIRAIQGGSPKRLLAAQQQETQSLPASDFFDSDIPF